MKKVKKVKKDLNYDRLTKTYMDPKPLMYSEDKKPRRKSLKKAKRR